jgi:hypothetical protein
MSNLVRIAEANQQGVNFEELRTQLKDELYLIDGVYYCTIRGLARLIDISAGCLTDNRALKSGAPHGLLQKIKACTLEELPESLKPIHGFDYAVQPSLNEAYTSYMLPEVVVSCVIKYYAYDAKIKKPRAARLDNLFSSMGVRTFFSNLLLDQPKQTVVMNKQENNFDSRLKAISDSLSVLNACTPEYKEQALLTLLDVLQAAAK